MRLYILKQRPLIFMKYDYGCVVTDRATYWNYGIIRWFASYWGYCLISR